MKRIIITTVFLSLVLMGFAQVSGKVVHTIKGKIVDASTNAAVSYTNIGLEGTYFGTASDANGNFELKIPESLVSKNIFFSAVGFKSKKFAVKTLFDKEFSVVKLESQSYGINDIDVAAQSKVLLRILRMASENIPYNYIGGPFNLLCTYENSRTINDTISVNQNANVVVFDKNGYINPSKLNAFRSLNYSIKKEQSEADYRFSTGMMNIDELLDLDWVRSASSVLNPELLAGFQLKLESEPKVEGKDCWLILYKMAKPTVEGSGDFYASNFMGKITISKEDYSVLQIQGIIKSPKNNRQGKSLAIGASNSNYLENVSSTFEVNYKNLKPEEIRLTKNYVNKGKKINEVSKLKINQVQTTNVIVIDSRDYFAGN